MPSSASETKFQRQSYNKRYYVRKVVMETLEERLWEAFRGYPQNAHRAKFVVWRDADDLSRFHVTVNTNNVKAPPMAWFVDLFFPENADKKGEPYLGDPIITVWSTDMTHPLLRITGATNRQLAEYASDSIVANVLEKATFKGE